MRRNVIIYLHGDGGTAEEAKHYESLFPYDTVMGFDYKATTPWEAVEEFVPYFEGLQQRFDSVILIANSIGAFFAMNALSKQNIEKAYLISPVVDMEQLIQDMMAWANVNEEELKRKGEIQTSFGQVLSWEYLSFVRNHPIDWNIPTHILYGEQDNLTSYAAISEFAKRTGATLTVMKNGEHWFHTQEQMAFLDQWIKNSEQK